MRQFNFNHVLMADSAQEGLAILRQQADVISLVILDIAMPEMNGFELARAIREDLHLGWLPIIALNSHPDIRQQAVNHGIDYLLEMPFHPRALRDLITKCLDNSAVFDAVA